MSEENRPVILVLCADPDRMAALRAALRKERVLTAPARTLDAALSLLTQVGVDGCVLAHHLTGSASAELEAALEQCRPGAFRLCVGECHGDHLREWHLTGEEQVPEEVWRLFSLAPGP